MGLIYTEGFWPVKPKSQVYALGAWRQLGPWDGTTYFVSGGRWSPSALAGAFVPVVGPGTHRPWGFTYEEFDELVWRVRKMRLSWSGAVSAVAPGFSYGTDTVLEASVSLPGEAYSEGRIRLRPSFGVDFYSFGDPEYPDEGYFYDLPDRPMSADEGQMLAGYVGGQLSTGTADLRMSLNEFDDEVGQIYNNDFGVENSEIPSLFNGVTLSNAASIFVSYPFIYVSIDDSVLYDGKVWPALSVTSSLRAAARTNIIVGGGTGSAHQLSVFHSFELRQSYTGSPTFDSSLSLNFVLRTPRFEKQVTILRNQQTSTPPSTLDIDNAPYSSPGVSISISALEVLLNATGFFTHDGLYDENTGERV